MNVQIQRELAEARSKARSSGWHEDRCPTCKGSGVGKHPNSNAETGYDMLDPCINCAGFGVLWYEGPTRTIVHRLDTRELLQKLRAA